MEISFSTKELRDQCADEVYAAKTLAPGVADALKRRVSDLCAADSIGDVLAGRPRPGIHQGEHCYFIELGDSHRLTVIPSHDVPRLMPDGSADWSLIRRVKVVSLNP